MSPVLDVLLFVLGVLVVVTLADAVRHNLGTKRTVAWILVVLLVPFVGSVLYWVLRDRPVLSSADPQSR